MAAKKRAPRSQTAKRLAAVEKEIAGFKQVNGDLLHRNRDLETNLSDATVENSALRNRTESLRSENLQLLEALRREQMALVLRSQAIDGLLQRFGVESAYPLGATTRKYTLVAADSADANGVKR